MEGDFIRLGRSYCVLTNTKNESLGSDIVENKWFPLEWQPVSVYVPESHQLHIRYDDSSTDVIPPGSQINNIQSKLLSPVKQWTHIKSDALMSFNEYAKKYICNGTNKSAFCASLFEKKNQRRLASDRPLNVTQSSTTTIIILCVCLLCALMLVVVLFRKKDGVGGSGR